MLPGIMMELRQLSHQVDLLAKILNEMQQTVQQGLGCQQQHAQLTAPAAAPAAAHHDDDDAAAARPSDQDQSTRFTFSDAEQI